MTIFGGLFQRKRKEENLPPLPPRSMSTNIISGVKIDLSDPDQLFQYVIELQAQFNHSDCLSKKLNKQLEDCRNEIRDLKFKNSNLQSKMKLKDRDTARIIELRKKEQVEACNTKNSLDLEKLKRIEQTREALCYEEEAVRSLLKLRSLEDNNLALVQAERTVDERAMLPSQPFVVVLVDGDGYRFENLAKHEGVEAAGINLAQRLHLAVSRRILMSECIPPSSKIVARIFVNSRGRLGDRRLSGMQHSPHQLMMIKFQETRPLFDYIECGSGKERADTKIQENARLYIADPNCHAVFLAVCNDNGFARLLEQYQTNPIAQAKIYLVDAGVVVTEIARLKGFTRVTLDGVFQDMYCPRTGTSHYNQVGAQGRITPPQGQAIPLQPNPAANLDSEKSAPPCRKRRKCKNRICRFGHQTSKNASVPTVSRSWPSTKPLTTNANEQSGKSPARLTLEAATYDTKQNSESGTSDGAQAVAIVKAEETKNSQPILSYLDLVGMHHVLPARVRDDPYLVPFPFRWSNDLASNMALHEELSQKRVVEVDVD